MKLALRAALPLLLIASIAACDWQEEILKQLDLDEVDVSLDMFSERDRQDPFRIDVVEQTTALASDEDMAGLYASFRHSVTIPSGGLTHGKLLAMAQVADLADHFGVPPVSAFGAAESVGDATFEMRLYNRDTIGDMATFLEESQTLASAEVDAGGSVELADVDDGELVHRYDAYADAVAPDPQGNYHLFIGAVAYSPIDTTVHDAAIVGYGFHQKSSELEPGDFEEYSGNVESVTDLGLTGYIENHNEDYPATVVITFGEQDTPDHDAATLLDRNWWVLKAEVTPGERVDLDGNYDVMTPRTTMLLEWAIVKLTKGRTIQTDVGIWCEGEVDVTLSVKLDSTIHTKLNL